MRQIYSRIIGVLLETCEGLTYISRKIRIDINAHLTYVNAEIMKFVYKYNRIMRQKIAEFLYWVGQKVDRGSIPPPQRFVRVVTRGFTIEKICLQRMISEHMEHIPDEVINRGMLRDMLPAVAKHIDITNERLHDEVHGKATVRKCTLKIAIPLP